MLFRHQGPAAIRSTAFLALLTCCPLAISVAAAQTEDAKPLEQVVVTASRRDQNINEVSRTVMVLDETVITSELAKSSNLGDLLGRQIPGFGAPSFVDITRNQTLRGREPLYLIDGVPLSFNGGGGFGRSPLVKFDSGIVERVEVLYGPTSLYGAGATGGVIQFFTANAPDDDEFALNLRQQVTLYPGADDTFSSDTVSWITSARAAGTVGRFDYIASISYDSQNGVIDGNGDLANPVYYGFSDDTSYFLKLGFEPDADQRIGMFISYVDRDFQDTDFTTEITDDGFAIGVEGDGSQNVVYAGDNEPKDEKMFFNFSYEHGDLWGNQLNLQVYDREDDIVGGLAVLIPFGSTSPQGIPFNYQASSLDTSTGVRLQIGRNFGERINLLVGADYEEQEREAPAVVYDLGPIGDPNFVITEPVVFGLFQYPFTLDTLGFFAQVEIEITDEFSLSGGVRHEDAEFEIGSGLRLFDLEQLIRPGGSGEDDGQAWNVGFTYNAIPEMTLYGSYAEGFQIPALAQLSGLVPPDEPLESNEAITPQIVESYELGVRGLVGSVNYSFAAFYSESDFGQLFLYDPVTRLGEYQRAPEDSYGFEITAGWQANSNLSLDGSFSWSEGNFDPDGDGPENDVAQSGLDIQPWKATLNIRYTINDRVSVNFQALAVGDRDRALDDEVDVWEVEGYEVYDLGFDIKIGPGMLFAQITNLFDNTYLTPTSQSYSNSAAFAPRVAGGPGRALSLVYDVDF